MSNKTKKNLKRVGLVFGICVRLGMLGLSWIALGNIFQAQYHDPDYYWHSVYQNARYGWSRKLNDGWAA